MNKSYRTLWNESLGAWVAASELSAACGKRSASRVLPTFGKLLATTAALWGLAASAQAQPTLAGNNSSFSIGGAQHDPNVRCIAIGVPGPANWPTAGDITRCTGFDSLAFGNSALASGQRGVAIGAGAAARETNGIAIGSWATVAPLADNGIAIGLDAIAAGTSGSTAVGQHAHANDVASTALGVNSTANARSSVAIGGLATTAVGATGSVAIGQQSGAGATYATALGGQANASADGSTALGHNTVAGQVNSVALGTGSVTADPVATASVTIRGTTYNFAGTTPGSSVSVGSAGSERQVSNVAAGRISATSTDAVNGSQLYATNQAIEQLATGGGGGDVGSVKYDLNADGTVNYNSVTLAGPASTDGGATGGTTITNVHQGAVNATSTDAINGAQLYNIAGDTSNTYVTNNGRGVRYVRTNDTGLPLEDAHATAQGASALGYNAVASGTNSVAIGNGAAASQAGSVALGAGSVTAAPVATASTVIRGTTYNFAGASPASSVSVGAAGSERQVSNVAAGRLSASSTDAVNGSQLYATNQAIEQLATGGGGGGIGNVKYDLNADGTVNYNSVTLAGPASTDGGATGGTTITNVHQGAVNATSTDAINGAQLYNIAGDTSNTYITNNGRGVRYVRTNDTGLPEDDAHATAQGASALGYNANASGASSTALGRNSQASGEGSVAVGVDTQAGTGTPHGAASAGNIAIGARAKAPDTSSGTAIAIGVDSVATTPGIGDPMAIGTQARATGQDAVAIGAQAIASGTNALSIGGNSSLNGSAAGTATGDNSSAVGVYAGATKNNASAFGAGALATGVGSTALGQGAAASTANSVALGAGSITADPVPTASTTIRGTTYNFAGTAPVGSVSVGSAGSERQVSNVAAGQLSATSTDAVNGSQLYATNQAIEHIIAGGGGNGGIGNVKYDVNVDGTVNYNSVTLAGPTSTDGGATGGTTITNVHQGAVNATSTDAINGAQLYNIAGDTSNTYVTNNGRGVRYVRTNDTGLPLEDAHATAQGASALGYNAVASGTNSVAIGNGAAASQANSVALGAGSVADRTNTVSVGKAGGERQITNVAEGTAGTDAVNLNQLKKSETGTVRYDVNADGTTNYNSVTLGNGQASSGTTISNVAPGVKGTDAVNVNQLNEVSQKVDRNTRKLSGGIAATAALAVVTPVEPGRYHLSGSVASYNGQAGIGFNLIKRSDNGQTTLHAGLGWGSGGGGAIVRVGMGFSF